MAPTLSKALCLSLMRPVLDCSGAAGLLGFLFFYCTSLFSCWGAEAGASNLLWQTAALPSLNLSCQLRKKWSKFLSFSICEDGVKCQLLPPAEGLRVPERITWAKLGWVWVQGSPSPRCLSLCSSCNPVSNLLILDQNHLLNFFILMSAHKCIYRVRSFS